MLVSLNGDGWVVLVIIQLLLYIGILESMRNDSLIWVKHFVKPYYLNDLPRFPRYIQVVFYSYKYYRIKYYRFYLDLQMDVV